jgi:3-oxoacyl-[acyl-carrier protein] reductase
MNNKPVILITGASKGLGLGITGHYLQAGYEVISLSRTGSPQHENHTQYLCDISKEKEVMEVIGDLKNKKTKIDVLINNAGIASMNFMVSTSFSKAKEIMDINFLGMFLVTREISKLMIRENKGRIINISSVSVPLHLQWQSLYAASKAALEEFTRITAKELAPFNITANILGPNPIATDLIKNIPDQNLENVLSMQAINRQGKLEDMIHCLDFFMDEKSNFITGQTIYLGGVY